MSGVLSAVGVIAAAAAAAAAILLPAGRLRALAMLVALALFPVLIAGDQWHSHQVVDLRHDPARLVALGFAALAASAALAAAFRRWPSALPLAIVFALPFRIPLHAGGQTANLLVPLYLVIAGGVLAAAFRVMPSRPPTPRAGGAAGGTAPEEALATAGGGGSPAATGPARHLPSVLACVVLLYAVQTLYSPDFSKSLQNVCFFFVPFALVYALLRDVTWSRKLLVGVLWVIAVEAVAFVAVGSIEYLSRGLFWNGQVIRSNEFHTYFRVNSVFWDPNIYGRWLALAIVVAMAALLWAKDRRSTALLTGLVAVAWFGLVPTFSQSSFIALLVGLAVLGALRWSLRWAAGGIAALAVAAVLVVLLGGGASKISFSRINVDTSGRAGLVSGGLHLFTQRPVWGYGAGSFPKAYREHVRTRKAPVSVSHTEPITVAAEQGIVGLVAYATLLVTALWTMGAGLFGATASRAGGAAGGGRSPAVTEPAHQPAASATAGGGGSPAATGPARNPPSAVVGRVAVLAAFVALLVHTMAYAGFFEDPIAWVLLAAGASLATIQDVPGVNPQYGWSIAGTSHHRA